MAVTKTQTKTKAKTTAKTKSQSTTKTTAKPSKRKATTAKKTSKVKKKITKKDLAAASSTEVTTKTEVITERVVTDRRKRVADKAAAREAQAPPPPPPPVEAVKITDVAGVVYDKADYDAMVEMYDSTIKDIREGEIVAGRVQGVTLTDVIVDVGFKSEGIIPISEFPPPVNVKVGDELEVYLDKLEDSNGQLILSKQKADFMRVWDQIREVHDSGNTVTGRIIRRIKGGLVVDIMSVDAFLPGSQVSLRQVPDFDALINTEMDLKIIKLNKRRRNIVVSRRVVLEENREELRVKLLKEIEVSQVRTGVVKNITDFGVFLDMGGVDGLLHITDMSWGRVRHPSEMVNLGESVEVKILDFDDKTSRISLGLKQLTPYPWENIEEKYPVGKKITGRVVSITDYGAFIELEKGIEGLIHISEMSWTQHIKHPSKIMTVNDMVDAVVLSVDKDNEKISLGIKQMEPDPWMTIEDKYPIESQVEGKVRNLTAFGAFVELEEGIDGLVHISDMSWTRRIQHPSEVMKKGDSVRVKVIKIDNDNRRISLGYKQLLENPWPELAKKLSVGTECLGTINKVFDRGVSVDIGEGVEGFVPTAQLGGKEVNDPTNQFSEGESIPLQVIEFDQEQRKVVLSVIAYYKNREKSEYEDFVSKHKTSDSAPADDAESESSDDSETMKIEIGAADKASPKKDSKNSADETSKIETASPAPKDGDGEKAD